MADLSLNCDAAADLIQASLCSKESDLEEIIQPEVGMHGDGEIIATGNIQAGDLIIGDQSGQECMRTHGSGNIDASDQSGLRTQSPISILGMDNQCVITLGPEVVAAFDRLEARVLQPSGYDPTHTPGMPNSPKHDTPRYTCARSLNKPGKSSKSNLRLTRKEHPYATLKSTIHPSSLSTSSKHTSKSTIPIHRSKSLTTKIPISFKPVPKAQINPHLFKIPNPVTLDKPQPNCEEKSEDLGMSDRSVEPDKSQLS